MQNIVDIVKEVSIMIFKEAGYMRNLRIKFRRIELNMSQADLARKAGVTRQTIGMIESGEFNPSLKLCLAICWALDLTLNDLFWEDKPDEENEE